MIVSFLGCLQVAILLADSPRDVADQKQLFIDHRFIADSDRVVLRMNPAQKLGPLSDEQGNPLLGHVSRVMEDQGKVRMYLGAENVRVLESDDGLHFRETGVKLPGGTFPTIFLDPHESDPARRYKLFHLEFSPPFDPARHGVYASYSADGAWTLPAAENSLPRLRSVGIGERS